MKSFTRTALIILVPILVGIAPATETFTGLGRNISIEGDYVLVSGDEHAALFNLSSGKRKRTFTPPVTDDSHRYGDAVLLHDGMAIIGDPGQGRGVIYIYDAQNGTMIRRIEFDSDSTQIPGEFGAALVADGNTLYAGAPSAYSGRISTDGLLVSVGGVYVVDLKTFKLLDFLDPEFGAHGQRFGSSIAISEKYIAVADPSLWAKVDENGETSDGIVHIFSKKTRQRLRKIVAPPEFTGGVLNPYFQFATSVVFCGGKLFVAAASSPELFSFNPATGLEYPRIQLVGGGSGNGLRVKACAGNLFLRECTGDERVWIIRCFSGATAPPAFQLRANDPYDAYQPWGGLAVSENYIVAGEQEYRTGPSYFDPKVGRVFLFMNPLRTFDPPVLTLSSNGTVRVEWSRGTLFRSTDLIHWTPVSGSSPYETSRKNREFFIVESP